MPMCRDALKLDAHVPRRTQTRCPKVLGFQLPAVNSLPLRKARSTNLQCILDAPMLLLIPICTSSWKSKFCLVCWWSFYNPSVQPCSQSTQILMVILQFQSLHKVSNPVLKSYIKVFSCADGHSTIPVCNPVLKVLRFWWSCYNSSLYKSIQSCSQSYQSFLVRWWSFSIPVCNHDFKVMILMVILNSSFVMCINSPCNGGVDSYCSRPLGLTALWSLQGSLSLFLPTVLQSFK